MAMNADKYANIRLTQKFALAASGGFLFLAAPLYYGFSESVDDHNTAVSQTIAETYTARLAKIEELADHVSKLEEQKYLHIAQGKTADADALEAAKRTVIKKVEVSLYTLQDDIYKNPGYDESDYKKLAERFENSALNDMYGDGSIRVQFDSDVAYGLRECQAEQSYNGQVSTIFMSSCMAQKASMDLGIPVMFGIMSSLAALAVAADRIPTQKHHYRQHYLERQRRREQKRKSVGN